MIERLAVIPVAISVRWSKLFNLTQRDRRLCGHSSEENSYLKLFAVMGCM